MTQAKLMPPNGDKNWSLHFIGVKFDADYSPHDIDHNPEKANIWYWCQHYGNFWNASPFLQGNSNDWMMIEFWTKSQSLVLECCLSICAELNVELQLV